MKIAIGAGHGPNTPGKRTPDGSLREYQFNSVVARYMADMLLEYEGVEILLVHDDSRDVPLKERTDRANAWGVDLYVSIHANAYGAGDWNDVQGIETFTYKTRPAEAVKLAEIVQRNLLAATGRPNRGVKAADYHVLRETRMTAILCECGFMTHRVEAELLKSDTYRHKCAEAIVAGIVETYGLQRKVQEVEQVEGSTRFADVPAGHWAETAIVKADAAGVIGGISDKEFGLGQPVTREQLAVILDRVGLLNRKGE